MSYAIEVLEKERQLIIDCLSDWEKEKYPEARKERVDKIKDLEKSINILKSKNLETLNNLLKTIEKNSIDNKATITNVEVFVKSWKRECNFIEYTPDDIGKIIDENFMDII